MSGPMDMGHPAPHHDEPVLLIRGERVGLGALRRDLLPRYFRWRSDPEVRKGMTYRIQPHTLESVEAWFEKAIQPGNDEIHFTIYDLHDMTPVGTALLVDVGLLDGTAEFGILLGERRGQGLGTEATRLVLDWAFTMLGLRNVLLATSAWNTPAIRAYLRVGFREIGRRRGAVLTMGERHDQVLMDAIASEFTGSVLAKQERASEPG
jgi:RimJ/RimL family protein N-acetyltransferase